MTKQNELRAIERRQYWLIARMLFVGKRSMNGAADAILRGIEIVGLMYRFHRLGIEKKRLIKDGKG